MSRLTIAIAAQITSQRHRGLISYYSGWYHIVQLAIPPSLLCGRPPGRHPTRWNPQQVMKNTDDPRSNGVWLCDECWSRYIDDQARKTDAQHGFYSPPPLTQSDTTH
jgi:hypothetical protein